ncbi:DNL-type zinc finger protein [Nymphaea thermarum]|nr:DNL-type zinc finger protein [Nymphaea thermarum]
MSSSFVFSSLSNTFCSHPKALHLARCSSSSKDHYVSFRYLLKNPLSRYASVPSFNLVGGGFFAFGCLEVNFVSILHNCRHVNASRRISQARHLHHCPLPSAGGSSDGNAELLSDSEQPSVDGGEPTRAAAEDATLGSILPRRSLLVQFTCNACGDRTQRFVNRVAYERGTIFLQCAGCQQYHKFVDNLGLVVEYDFRKEEDTDTDKIDVQQF